jgi:hypothetical protein
MAVVDDVIEKEMPSFEFTRAVTLFQRRAVLLVEL